ANAAVEAADQVEEAKIHLGPGAAQASALAEAERLGDRVVVPVGVGIGHCLVPLDGELDFAVTRNAGVDDADVRDVAGNDVGWLGDQVGKPKRRTLANRAFVVHLVDDDAFGAVVFVAACASDRGGGRLLLPLPVVQ